MAYTHACRHLGGFGEGAMGAVDLDYGRMELDITQVCCFACHCCLDFRSSVTIVVVGVERSSVTVVVVAVELFTRPNQSLCCWSQKVQAGL